jgi:hypothetical protein
MIREARAAGEEAAAEGPSGDDRGRAEFAAAYRVGEAHHGPVGASPDSGLYVGQGSDRT